MGVYTYTWPDAPGMFHSLNRCRVQDPLTLVRGCKPAVCAGALPHGGRRRIPRPTGKPSLLPMDTGGAGHHSVCCARRLRSPPASFRRFPRGKSFSQSCDMKGDAVQASSEGRSSDPRVQKCQALVTSFGGDGSRVSFASEHHRGVLVPRDSMCPV